MKICYMGNIDAVHTQRWAKAFAQMGHETHVIYMGGKENNILDLEKAGISVHLLNRQASNVLNSASKIQSTEIPERIRDIEQKIYMGLSQKITVPLKMYLVNPKRLKNLLNKIKPDILHAWFLYDSGCIAALSGYKPLIVSSWGSDVTLKSHDVNRPLWMLKWANRLSLKKADIITATSEWLTKQTAKFAPEAKTIYVVPFGIDCDMFNPANKGINTDIITIGFAKHLKSGYGPDILIEAFGNLIRKYPFIELKMAGEGHMLEELKRRIESIGIKEKVTFFGKIPHNEMPVFLSDVDIAVQPSRDDCESFGVAALEASAMGIPVVSTRVGGVPECVKDGETGILVEPDNAEALARAISFLIENPQKREQMGEAGREFVLKNYQWKDSIEEMLKIYQLTLSNYKSR